jgi:hypothetical protein
MEFLEEGRLLDNIPLSAVGPGEDLHEGLFFCAVPDLRPHRVAPAVLQGLHPEKAVEEHKGLCHDHGDDLTGALDGSGQGNALPGPLYSCVGKAEVELPYFDLPDFPKMSVHDHLTPDGGIDPLLHPRIRKNDTSDHPSSR